MKISTFIHVINESEIWDALEKKIIVLDENTINYILENKNNIELSDVPNALVELGIVTTPQQEIEKISELKKQTTDNQFQSLFLVTTTECNLDCSYCFYRSSASESLKKRENMPFEIAKSSIDKFYNIVLNNKKDSSYWQQITFYGGEPAINKYLLIRAIPYVREKFQDGYTGIVINTNLTILDDELIKLFKDNNVEVQVSIDGQKEVHDQYRKTQSGVGTYDVVIKNIKLLVENGVKVLPMITATDANVAKLSDIILEVINTTGINDFAVNVLITDTFVTDGEYTTILSEQMIKAYCEYGNYANDYVFYDLYEMLIGKDKRIVGNSCGSTRKITVFPSGSVYACQALQKLDYNYMGSIYDAFTNNHNWDLWRTRNRFNNQNCLDCEVVASCGGGCAAGSYNATNSINGIDTNNCEYTKKLFKQLVCNKR